MKRQSKLQQLQIRVSSSEKASIQRAAKLANMGMSEWILSQILPHGAQHFQQLVRQLKRDKNKSYILAELHDLFNTATSKEFERMVAQSPQTCLLPYWENYLAAMIEYTANVKEVRAPAWVHEIVPLDKPVFATDLLSLRLYLLTHSPPSFRARNIFIDSTVGQRK